MESLSHWLGLDQFVPMDLLVVLVLVVLEGLLSCDNAVVLALLVKDLPDAQRGKALRYGILGAYVFRIVALGLATWIMSKWYLKVLGGLYLAWIAWRHFARHDDEQPSERALRRIFGMSPFWSTVVAVELTDIVFSVDSIAVAVAMSDKMWVLICGALFGILAMRFAAQGFVKLLKVFPRLEGAAFVAVAFIGVKLMLEFPVDVAGSARPFPEAARYATADEYIALAETHAVPLLHVDHVVTINLAAPPEPERSILLDGLRQRLANGDTPPSPLTLEESADREFRRAESKWNLHYRPFVEVEGWVSSLVVLVIFGFGFVRRAPSRPLE
jgi:YkoY family integral membrane protein